MHIALGSDHAGFPLKSTVAATLRDMGHEVLDMGSYTPDPVDFPDIAHAVCTAVVDGKATRGILVCGTGIGASIAANKIRGVRAALCHDVHSAHQSVEHDDANVLCIGAKIVGEWLTVDIIRAYMSATFGGEEEYVRRINKIQQLEVPQSKVGN